MKTSQTGINLIKKYEGCRLKAYKCPAGLWTIGYGHTKGVKKGQKITQKQAERYLKEDLQVYEKSVEKAVKVTLNQNQFDALISFVYNCGAAAFRNSTLLKKLNAGDYKGASAEFPRWNKSGGRVLNGLKYRRKAERALFDKIPASTIYVVKKGDTLAKIASKHNTTVENLVKLNNIKNPDVILIGQKLKMKG